VIAGKDAQQNETIVKKYLKDGDVYVHADIHGASSCIVKNVDRSKPVSPVTLHEVGHAAVCHSAAWNAKVLTSAWWVHANQVSKTAPSGEYLSTGSFMIRGKKNYLPPSQLVLGFGFLFKLDDACVARHAGERKIKGLVNEVEEKEESELSEIKEENETKPKLEGEDDDDSDDSDSKSDVLEFPDTKINIKYNVDTEVEEIVNVGKGAGKRNLEERRKEAEKKGRAKPAWQLEHEEAKAEKDKFRKKRGKAGKEKKMKQKYGEQDEEDRAAMMEFLGSAGAKKLPKKLQRQAKRESKGVRGQKKPPKEKKGNTFERANEELAPPEVLPEDPNCKAEMVVDQMKDDVDEQEVAKMLEEEGFVEDDDVSMLDSLTGKPTDEDLVHYAVPVVAPLSSLRDYKYHIKFVPGTGKKGKSAKQVVGIFCGKKEARQVEIDLMRAVKDEDMTHNMPGKLKLAGQQVQMYKKKK